ALSDKYMVDHRRACVGGNARSLRSDGYTYGCGHDRRGNRGVSRGCGWAVVERVAGLEWGFAGESFSVCECGCDGQYDLFDDGDDRYERSVVAGGDTGGT